MHTERIEPKTIRATAFKVAESILGNEHPILPIIENGSAGEIFSWINTLGKNTKPHIVEGFLMSPELNVPNAVAVSRFVLDALKVARWSPILPAEKKSVHNEVREYQLRLGQKPLNVHFISPETEDTELKRLEELAGTSVPNQVDNSHRLPRLVDKLMYRALTAPSPINKAREALRKRMEEPGKGVAYTSKRIKAYNAVAHLVYEGIKQVAGWAAVPLTFGALYEVLSDQMPKDEYPRGNPFEPLKRLYKMGCMPIGVIDNEFYVYIPQNNGQTQQKGWNPLLWAQSLFKRKLDIGSTFVMKSLDGETPEVFIDRVIQDVESNYQRAVLYGYYISKLLSTLGIQMLAYDHCNHQDEIPHIFSKANIDRLHFQIQQWEQVYSLEEALSFCIDETVIIQDSWTQKVLSMVENMRNDLIDSVEKSKRSRLDSEMNSWFFHIVKRIAGEDIARVEIVESQKRADIETPVAGDRAQRPLYELIGTLKERRVKPFFLLLMAKKFQGFFKEAGISETMADEISNLIDRHYEIDAKLIASLREKLNI